jgi:hypothetical protein
VSAGLGALVWEPAEQAVVMLLIVAIAAKLNPKEAVLKVIRAIMSLDLSQ